MNSLKLRTLKEVDEEDESMMTKKRKAQKTDFLGSDQKENFGGLICQPIYSKVKDLMSKKLNRKEAHLPKKMRIKEFENFFEDSIKSINSFVRQAGMRLKRSFVNSNTSENQLIRVLQETITTSSLAGGILIFLL